MIGVKLIISANQMLFSVPSSWYHTTTSTTFRGQSRRKMEFDARAARRPLPRQLDSTDWNLDADSRRTRVDAQARLQPHRSGLEPSSGRRLSSGEELRPLPQLRSQTERDVLQPANRYDSVRPLSERHSERTGLRQEWRASEGSSDVRHLTGSDRLAAPREQPRGHGSSLGSAAAVVTRRGVPRASMQSQRIEESVDRTPTASARETPPREYRQWRGPYEPSSFSSPSPSFSRYTTTTGSARSEVSTAVSSFTFSPSLTDTPTTSMSSSAPTPPVTPERDNGTTHGDGTEQSPLPDPSISERTSHTSVASSPATRESLSGSSDPLEHARNADVQPSHAVLTQHEQREQLYSFRRDMRQIFARVDEMVDMHRDLFKSDPLSGLPNFDAAQARDVAAFASSTFDQLTSLRDTFETMTTSWSTAKIEDESLDSLRRTSQRPSTISNQDRSVVSDSTPSSGSSTPHSKSHSDRSSSLSSLSFPTGHSRQRWQPTLSSVSNQSAASSSSSEKGTSNRGSIPLSETSPPTMTSVARENVFDDFDRRMEEIRASLSALARDRPARLSVRSSSSRLSHRDGASPLHRKHGSSSSPSSSSSFDHSHENNGCASNRVQKTDRHDREVRLRQLLMELRETGDSCSDTD